MNHRFMSMEPTNQTFQELLSNGVRYIVPRFQRDYTWYQEQWEDLWADIETLDQEHFHYIGYIVLQRKGAHDFEVVDGQQRLVTLSLLVLAAMRQLRQLVDAGVEATENSERIRVLTERFIGSKNPISLKVDSKLSLNRNNGAYFKAICSNLDAPRRRGLTVTNRLLYKAFDFFCEKEMGDSGAEIAKFVEQVTSSMVFTKIVVQDDLNAYKVFETLNARDVQLSTPDLIKNYLFSVITRNHDVPDEDLDELDADWSVIVDQLGESNFTDFIRYHHNFQKTLVTKKDLFTSVRKLTDTPESAYAYLRSLTIHAPLYASLQNPHDGRWEQQLDHQQLRVLRIYLEGLRLFNIKQPFTILMAAFTTFSKDEFIKLAKYLYVLSIRYNVICHQSANEQEKAYNQIAIKIHTGDFSRASHVKNSEQFKRLYPKDDSFINSFGFHKMPGRQTAKKIRFLLSQIESHLGHQTDYIKTTLEHVCPYHPDEHWHDYFGEGINDIQDRLGNMVLLDVDHLKRAEFTDKKRLTVQATSCLPKR